MLVVRTCSPLVRSHSAGLSCALHEWDADWECGLDVLGQGSWKRPCGGLLQLNKTSKFLKQRGEEEPAGKRCSLGRNNELTHFVKEEVAGLKVLSQLKQNGCFPGGKGWIQTADSLRKVCQSFILLDLWEGNTQFLELVWDDCQMCQVPGKC